MYANRPKIHITLLLMVIIILILFFILYTYISHSTRNYGYLSDLHHNILRHSSKYTYSIQHNQDKLDSMTCNASYQNNIIGTLIFIPWKIPNLNYTLYIGNNLHVMENHRNKGVANQIILKTANTVVPHGGFGLFSTSYKLSIPNKLSIIYWTKVKPNTNQIPNTLKFATYDTLLYENYPTHPWLNVPTIQRKNYLKYLQNNGMKFINIYDKSLTIAIETIIDSQNHKVAQIKWFWGKKNDLNTILANICTLLKHEYIAVPQLTIPTNIWDQSISYIYCKPSNLVVPELKESHIYGWYLDR